MRLAPGAVSSCTRNCLLLLVLCLGPVIAPAGDETREVRDARHAVIADYYQFVCESSVPEDVLREAGAVLQLVQQAKDPEEVKRLRRIMRDLFQKRVGGE
jgi:hypothetical protein